MAVMFTAKTEILLDMERSGIEIIGDTQACLSSLVIKATLLDLIKAAQAKERAK
jgi:hypothetical protein